jgi:hypothetical protein
VITFLFSVQSDQSCQTGKATKLKRFENKAQSALSAAWGRFHGMRMQKSDPDVSVQNRRAQLFETIDAE